jgi:hypothetical protein
MGYSLGGAEQDKREAGTAPGMGAMQAVRGRMIDMKVIDMKLIDVSWRRIGRDISRSWFCNIRSGVASWKEKVRPFAGMTRIRFKGSPRRLFGLRGLSAPLPELPSEHH